MKHELKEALSLKSEEGRGGSDYILEANSFWVEVGSVLFYIRKDGENVVLETYESDSALDEAASTFEFGPDAQAMYPF